MPPHEPVAFRPVSYSPRTERSMSPVKPRIPLERRSAVHFDYEPAPNQRPEPVVPIEKPAPAVNGTRVCSSNSSATRSAAATAGTTPTTTVRPTRPALETYDGIELTAVDKKWGRLFEVDGQPTERFREAMHSLARHILHAFPSSENLVLVPSKLASFYNFHGISSDPFRYEVIFQSKDRDHNRRIADLYQDLGCSYHLVQVNPGSQPRIPGLTPDGFTRWMALHLQAFPDGVSQRLDRVISDFPLDVVSVLDGRAERLPKQLSRYLLPRVPDGRIRSLLQQAVKRHFGEAALLAVSFPDETKERPRPRTSQSCPSSPSLGSFAPPSTSTTSAATGPQPRRRDAREERRPEVLHRASDPGTIIYHVGKLLTPLHRRHASYPGPQSTLRTSSESARDRRVHSDHDDRDHQREKRRHRSPSRSRSVLWREERDLQAVSDNHDGHHSYHRRHSFKDLDRHCPNRDSPRRSSSRPGYKSQSGSDARDVRRHKYSPSPLAATHACPSAASSTDRDAPRSTTATNTSARRAPSPKSHTIRASLPEIHHTDRMRQSSTHEADLGRGARGHVVDADRRASCHGLTVLAASEKTPLRRSSLSDSGRQRGDAEDGRHHTKAREDGYRMERRAKSNGDDTSYRLYASSTVASSPLSSAPVLKYSPSTSAAGQEKTKTEPVKVPTLTPKLDTSASSPPRRIPLRPSLSATVTTLEHELRSLRDEDGNESDQTWDDYLRTSPRVAPVSERPTMR